MPFPLKKILPHLIVLSGFAVLSLAYFNPVLQGKEIFQSDIIQYTGMANQHIEFRNQTGEETYWTNSAFSGMPTYQLGAHYPHNYIKKLDLTLRFLPRPADYVFLYFMGFYVLLLVLRLEYKLAALGALAFGFSTYLIIILGVGHNSKAHAIAYMPLVLSGILLTFRKKYLAGFLLTALAMGLEITANHFQMTYYLMLLVIVLGFVYLINAYKSGELAHYFKSLLILLAAVFLSVGLNATGIMATQEYVKESTRGKSELTMYSDGSPKELSSGLDRDYITEFSYGLTESFNLFIPRFMGGGNGENVGKDSNTYEAYRRLGATPGQALEASKAAPMYWGKQPIVEAPAYVGAVVIFLFVLASFLVKERQKHWLLAGIIMSLILSWGKNFFFVFDASPDSNPITNLMIDYFPLYNKFRAVSSIQVILELCVPVLAILGLGRFFSDDTGKDLKIKALKYATLITAGLAMAFLLFKDSLFDFAGLRDGQYIQAYGRDFMDAVKEDRKAIFNSDTIRSLVFVLIAAGTLWMFLKHKLSKNMSLIVFGLLIVFDLVAVDRRYVNNDDFVSSIQVKKPYRANAADLEILKDTTHYRVLDLTSGSTKASYFHNALSGYHAAKMRRYNDVLEFYIDRNHLGVLNMLNTKYIINRDDDNQPIALINPDANGNGWFIERLKLVKDADSEILALDSLNTKREAVFNDREFDLNIKGADSTGYILDSLAFIHLTEYQPNYLKYRTENTNNGFAVFSENFYYRGWQAYLNGEPVDHVRVNYILRGMEIPAGSHTIEFKFEPAVVRTGSGIALASSVLLGLLLIGGLLVQFKKQ
jgi:hypothetical protein